VGRWELIIAFTIFAVNGLLGYLAKRQKDQARRQAELEAAGGEVSPTPAAERKRGRTARTGQKPASARRPAEVRADGRTDGRAGVRSGRKATPPAAKATRPPPPPAPRPGVVPGGMRTKVAPAAPSMARVPPVAGKPGSLPVPAPAPSDSRGVTPERVRRRLRDRSSLRELFVAAEILGRPRGLSGTGPDAHRPG